MQADRDHPMVFAGIEAPNTTPVPDIYFDVLFPRLGKGSLKVLLYLVRRTFGFKKDGDTVSLSQICNGIRRHNGTPLDRGTGLTRSTATAAIRELEKIGAISATRRVSSKGDSAVTYYTLRFREQMTLSDLLQDKASTRQYYLFPGIDSPNTTPVPDAYFDLLLPEMGLAEWRVLLYVIRRTLGFKKISDTISLDQFSTGITTRDGTRLDHGTGLARSAVSEALGSLVERNVLARQRVRDARGGDGVSLYSLVMHTDARLALAAAIGCTDDMPLPAPDAAPLGPNGGREMNHPGFVQSDQGGALESDYQVGIPTWDRNTVFAIQNASLHVNAYRDGHHMSSGVVRKDCPEESDRTTPSSPDHLPVVQIGYPQETEIQKTEQQREREQNSNATEVLLMQIATDLGVPKSVPSYYTRIMEMTQAIGCEGPDVYEALIAAWKATRQKARQHALTRPSAALAYFYTVLCEHIGIPAAQHMQAVQGRVEPSRQAPPQAFQAPYPRRAVPADVTRGLQGDSMFLLQDPTFFQQLEECCGARLPDQGPWQAILSGLATTLTPANYARWFTQTALLAVGDALLVAVPDQQSSQRLTASLMTAIRREAQAIGEDREVQFITYDELTVSLSPHDITPGILAQ